MEYGRKEIKKSMKSKRKKMKNKDHRRMSVRRGVLATAKTIVGVCLRVQIEGGGLFSMERA